MTVWPISVCPPSDNAWITASCARPSKAISRCSASSRCSNLCGLPAPCSHGGRCPHRLMSFNVQQRSRQDVAGRAIYHSMWCATNARVGAEREGGQNRGTKGAAGFSSVRN